RSFRTRGPVRERPLEARGPFRAHGRERGPRSGPGRGGRTGRRATPSAGRQDLRSLGDPSRQCATGRALPGPLGRVDRQALAPGRQEGGRGRHRRTERRRLEAHDEARGERPRGMSLPTATRTVLRSPERPMARDLAHLSDEALLSLIAGSDEDALAELYDRFGG